MPRLLYLLALAVFAMGTSEFMLAGLVPDIARDLDVSVGTAGLLTSAFAVGMVVGAPAMAASARRWPARATLAGCVVVFAVCHVVAAGTPSFTVLLASRVVAAVANAGFLAVALSTAARLVTPDRTGRAVAVLLSGTTLATVVGVPAGALLGSLSGWRATFWAVALLCVLALLGLVRRLPVRQDAVPPPDLASELAQLRQPPLLLVLLLGALVNGGTFAAFIFLAPLVTDTAGLDRVWVPVALALFGLGSWAGVIAAGRLSDGHPRRVLATLSPVMVLGWLLLGVVAAHPLWLMALLLVQGAVAFAVGSTLIALALRAAHGAPTMGGAYATAALNVGAAAGPAVGALVLPGLGERGPLWAAAAASGLAALLMTVVTVRRGGVDR